MKACQTKFVLPPFNLVFTIQSEGAVAITCGRIPSMKRLIYAFSKTGLGTFRPRELWGSFFDLCFLVPITGILIDSESGGSAHSLGLNFLYLGGAYLLSVMIFRTPLPLQPLKVWAFLFLILHPTPMIASVSAVLLGLLLFLSGQLGLTDTLSGILDDAAIRGVKRAVSIYVYSVGAISLFLWALHHLPGIDLSRFQGSIPGIGAHSPGTVLEVLLMVLPQLPVTLVNGVLATVREKRATDTLSESSRHRLTGNMTSCWLGLANLLAGFLGLLPFCHGSGGLRSYRKYNIRTIFPSFCSSAILILLGFTLIREKITLPGPAFFALFLAGFLFAEFLITRGETRKAGSAAENADNPRNHLGIWILSGGMLSGLVALGGIPAALIFLLGMNTVLSLSKADHRMEKTGGQSSVQLVQDISLPEKILGSNSHLILTPESSGLFMKKSHKDKKFTLSPSENHSPAAISLLTQKIHLPAIGVENPLFSTPAISSSAPVRGDPELIRFLRDFYRRPRETIDPGLLSLLFLLFLFFFSPSISQSIPETSRTTWAVQKTFFSGPPRTRAP